MRVKYCCTLALVILVMSITLWDRIETTFPSTQYTHCSKTYHVMTSYIYTLSKGSAGAVTGCGKFLAK